MPNLPVVTPDLQFYLAHNVRGVMLQGAYQSPGGSDASLKCWVWAKQMWDPSLDTKTLIRDFNYGYYDAAAGPMQLYQELLWKTWLENHHGILDGPGSDIRYAPTLGIFMPDFLKQATDLMQQAKSLATDPETLRRVELAESAVLYLQLSQDLAIALKGGKIPDVQTCNTQLDEFERIAHQEKITYLWEGEPGNTDSWIAMVRRVVGADPRTLQGSATAVGVSDAGGDPGKVDWTKATVLAPWRTLTGASTSREVEGRLAHDGSYLYLQLQEKLDPKTLVMTDDNVWSEDEWEIFVAKQRGKPYRQMGVNARGVHIDLAFGENTQKWDSGAVIVSDRSAPDRWTTRIAFPLAQLLPGGVQPGDTIYLNVIRSTRGDNALSWIPTFGGYHAPERLGEVLVEK
jgi:hypothetical protein